MIENKIFILCCFGERELFYMENYKNDIDENIDKLWLYYVNKK